MSNKKDLNVSLKRSFSGDDLYIYEQSIDASKVIASKFFDLLQEKPQQSLGLIASQSVTDIYGFIVELVNNAKLSLQATRAFLTAEFLNLNNLDASLFKSVFKQFLLPVKIDLENVFVPSFNQNQYYQALNPAQFHQKLIEFGPIDQQLLWVGENGQLAFNEPNYDLDSINQPTNVINLSTFSQTKLAKAFHGNPPSQAISMGLLELIHAKKIYLPIYGQEKVQALLKLFQATDFDPNWPITALIYAQGEVEIYTDKSTSDLFFDQLSK